MSDNLETETIRKVYCWEDPDGEYYFDKWLSKLEAENYDRGIYNERERIIKLLEVLWQKTQGTDIPAVVVLPEAVALIKGENK